jgi:hypothetical protein
VNAIQLNMFLVVGVLVMLIGAKRELDGNPPYPKGFTIKSVNVPGYIFIILGAFCVISGIWGTLSS